MKKRYFIYDSECGLCSSFVKFILNKSNKDSFFITSNKSDFAQKLLNDHSIKSTAIDGAIYFKEERFFFRTSAVLSVLADCRAPYSWLNIFILIPTFIRDYLYKIFSNNRMKISKHLNLSCSVDCEFDKNRVI